MSAIESRVRKLEQTPAYATRLLAQQARDKLADGVPAERLSDAEIAAVIRTAPPDERAQIESFSDAELEAIIAGQWPGGRSCAT